MKYIVIFLLAVMIVYMYSFTGYNWRKKNKFAAIGIALLTLISIAFPLIIFFGG